MHWPSVLSGSCSIHGSYRSPVYTPLRSTIPALRNHSLYVQAAHSAPWSLPALPGSTPPHHTSFVRLILPCSFSPCPSASFLPPHLWLPPSLQCHFVTFSLGSLFQVPLSLRLSFFLSVPGSLSPPGTLPHSSVFCFTFFQSLSSDSSISGLHSLHHRSKLRSSFTEEHGE